MNSYKKVNNPSTTASVTVPRILKDHLGIGRRDLIIAAGVTVDLSLIVPREITEESAELEAAIAGGALVVVESYFGTTEAAAIDNLQARVRVLEGLTL